MRRILLISSLLLLSLAILQATVIGIDFGTEYFKISLIRPGKSFVIIENTTSKRKTASAIAFLNGERVYESDAVAKRNRNAQNTFVFMQKYLGALSQNVAIFEVAKQNYEDYLFEIDPDRGTLLFELKDFKLHDEEQEEKVLLSVEEVTAMILKHAKRLAEKQGGLEIKDCVLTVPGNWGSDQKRALLDAISLSGLHLLAFVNENTAGALYYGIERNDNSTHTALFYNLGSSSLKVSLVEYLAVNSTDKSYKKPIETVRVLADTVVGEVSGLAFDRVLAEHFADVFDRLPARQHKSSIRSSSSGMIKLLKECNKLKEVLSANKESPFYVENLFDGEDFKAHIERRVFEEKSQHILDQLTKPIDYVLKKGNRTLADVNVLEILGGAVRVPKVQQILADYLGNVELGAHLNGDEAMAYGAAFIGANLSHSFKVRPVWLYDGNNYEIVVYFRNLEDSDERFEKNMTVFNYKYRFGGKKTVSVHSDRNLRMELAKRTEDGQEEVLVSLNITNVSEIAKNEKWAGLGKPKIMVNLEVTMSWPAVEIDSVEAYLEETKIVEVEDVKASKSKPKPANDSSNATSEETSESEPEKSSEDSNNGTETQKKVVFGLIYLIFSIKTKKKVLPYFIPLKHEVRYNGLKGISTAQFEASRRKLIEFDKHEEFLKKNSESKNKLEAFIYKVRDHLEEKDFMEHASPIEKDQLTTLISENDDWLYSEEAFSSNHTEFNRRFHRMYSIASDITHRLEENRKRPAVVEAAFSKLLDFEKKIRDLNRSMPWVNETHKAPALEEIEKLREWIKEKTRLQAEKPKYEDPVFTVGTLEFKLKDVKESYINLKNIKKPKDAKKKKIEEEAEKPAEKVSEEEEGKPAEPEAEKHDHDGDLEEKNPEKEQLSERDDL